ncbi:MAG: undecaprenyldiphospho-muramoylpentapeptide beta-N-acetylglucosaminyltransferase [bacterium]
MSNEPGREVPTVIITGGGTGGHLYPALAVAEEIRRLRPDWNLYFYGRNVEKEQREVERRGIPFTGLPLQGLRRRFTLENVKALALTIQGLYSCYTSMRHHPRGAVFGVGGYVSAPAMLSGRFLGWKVALHEQNTIPGLVNRTMARWCDQVFVTFEKSREYFAGPVIVSGLPIRPELLSRRIQREPEDQKPPSVLVIGGSQGARRVVEIAMRAFQILHEQGVPFQALIQTGERNYEWAGSLPGTQEITLKPFISDMSEAYNYTDLIVSRAGSSSLSEIAAFGLPSILVPYPYASENHQKVNAEVFAQAGAAVVYEENQLTAEQLAQEIETLLQDSTRRRKMGEQARTLAYEESANIIASHIIELVEHR